MENNETQYCDSHNKIHRSIRRQKVTRSTMLSACMAGFVCEIIFVIKIVFVHEISQTLLNIVKWIMHPIIEVRMAVCTLFKSADIFYIPVEIAEPTTTTSVIILAVSLIVMVVLPKIKKIPLPLTILCEVLIMPMFIYSVLFCVLPEWFEPSEDSVSIVFSQSTLLLYMGFPLLLYLMMLVFPCGFWKRLLYVLLYELIVAVTSIIKYIIVVPLLYIGNQYVVPYVILLVLTMYDVIVLNSYFSNISCRESKKLNEADALWEKR